MKMGTAALEASLNKINVMFLYFILFQVLVN